MRREEFSYIMKNILKPKKDNLKDVEDELNSFKYENFIVHSPFNIIDGLSIGANSIHPKSSIKKINTIIQYNYPSKTTKSKKNKLSYDSLNKSIKSVSYDTTYSTPSEDSPMYFSKTPKTGVGIIGIPDSIESTIPNVDYESALVEGEVEIQQDEVKQGVGFKISNILSNAIYNPLAHIDYHYGLHGAIMLRGNLLILIDKYNEINEILNTYVNLSDTIISQLSTRYTQYWEIINQYTDKVNELCEINLSTIIDLNDKIQVVENYQVIPEKVLTSLETLLQNHKGYIARYGTSIAIIKGYILNNEVITSNKRLLEVYNKDSLNGLKTIILTSTYSKEENKVKFKIVISNKTQFQNLTKDYEITLLLPLIVDFKVVDCKSSNKFFKKESTAIRKELIDYSRLSWRLEKITITRKKASYTTWIVIVQHEETKEEVKFLISDCEFTTKSILGYNIPKDKTISINSIVKLLDNKLEKYCIRNQESSNAGVISIKPNPSTKKISSRCNNHRMDVITIQLISNNRIVKVYAKDLKFIENKQIQDVTKEKSNKKYSDFIEEDYYKQIQYLAGSTYIAATPQYLWIPPSDQSQL